MSDTFVNDLLAKLEKKLRMLKTNPIEYLEEDAEMLEQVLEPRGHHVMENEQDDNE